MKDIIKKRIIKFTKIIENNKNYLYYLLQGFWIKQIKSKGKIFYEFRVNSGDVNLQNKIGIFLLMFAIENNNKEIVKLLINENLNLSL